MNRRKKFHANAYAGLALLALLFGAMPAFFNLIVDPYAIFTDRNRPAKIEEMAEKAHYPLWKLAKYQRGRHETIILGDSRARALREKYWHSLGVKGVRNLAYGGGTIPEIHETFKIIRTDPAVRNLIVGIQLRSFDEDHKQGLNRVPEALSLINSPFRYAFNWTIAKTSLRVLRAEYPAVDRLIGALLSGPSKARASEKNTAIADPVQNHLALLQRSRLETSQPLPKKFARQIEQNARSDWKNFEFSDRYWSYIAEIGNWAKANGKNLIFVIPPTIVQMQQTIADHGLAGTDKSLRRHLAKFGLVVDFDYANALSQDLGNFTDAYHFNSKTARQIVGEITSVLSDDAEVQSRIKKRRRSVNCRLAGFASKPSSLNMQAQMQEGENCRYWLSRI